MNKIVFLLVFVTILPFKNQIFAQKKGNTSIIIPDTTLYNNLPWRNLGPFRGGRSAAVTGVSGKPNLFYFGSTGGGVWRTTDAGNTWENISDGYFGGSIGAVAVSEWDNNVIYVGGGEKTVRGNVSFGSGMWKSEDAGKTWKSIGLSRSRHIPRIRIHPKNPDLVYAAVLGDLFQSSDERGVYRSTNGGKTWERILFANPDAGAIDLIMDPNNSRILYASTWRVRRTPYSLESGGSGSALWKSTDGGNTWKNISANSGLPSGLRGISGITVSPINSNRLWAIIENENGGVYRSDNAGDTWQLTNSDRNLRQRAWYYSRIYADTKDVDMVYVVNVDYHRSKDGGKTFEAFSAPHGDHHDLWIAPEDNQRMIIADDGGAQVSFDGGTNWSTYLKQPTAQIYRVVTDNAFPYRIYGAQQDNSTIRMEHRTNGGQITERNWEETAGGESAHLAVDPLNNDIVYGGSYGGYLSRYNHKTKEQQVINVWPDNPMGYGAEGMKYRFQWNFPVFFSPNSPEKLYTASNYLHVSTNGGQSWQTISPDLTRNEKSKLGPSGGPITKDNTGVEYYCTIFAACESVYEKEVLWTGSDDGLVHVSKNGGKNWENVTPVNMPIYTMINSIDPDPFTPGGAYIAGTKYKSGDYTPYIYKTSDYGKSWVLITNGINNEHFTRVVRADKVKKGLLYAGTEQGLYISFNDGVNWQPLNKNFPVVPVTDLTIKDNNLIVATQGRGFWILDDITVLQQVTQADVSKPFFLYKPTFSYRMEGADWGISKIAGQNHPGGVLIHFWLKDTVKCSQMVLKISDSENKVIKEFYVKPPKGKEKQKLTVKPGLNRFVWDMYYPGAERFDGMILWWASLQGPKALPGKYQVELVLNDQKQQQEFIIVKDPRATSSVQQLKAQFDLVNALVEKLSETNTAIKELREVKNQIYTAVKNLDTTQYKQVTDKSSAIVKNLTAIEETLYQTKNRSGQDPLNYPIQLNNKLGHLIWVVAEGDFEPTQQAKAFADEITALLNEQLAKLKTIYETDIPELNRLIKAADVNAIRFQKK